MKVKALTKVKYGNSDGESATFEIGDVFEMEEKHVASAVEAGGVEVVKETKPAKPAKDDDEDLGHSEPSKPKSKPKK